MARRRKTEPLEPLEPGQPLEPWERRRRGLRGALVNADARARVWDLHLRGWSFGAIGREVGLDHKTVSGVVRRVYHELEQDYREALESAQAEAIERLRHIQRQAWADHDTDDEREWAVLSLALGEQTDPKHEKSDGERDKSDPKHEKRRDSADHEQQPSVRFTSQRAAYLRVALDCEKEIARLRGLYTLATPADDGAQFIFRIERVEPDLTPRPPLPRGEGEAQVMGLPAPGDEGDEA